MAIDKNLLYLEMLRKGSDPSGLQELTPDVGGGWMQWGNEDPQTVNQLLAQAGNAPFSQNVPRTMPSTPAMPRQVPQSTSPNLIGGGNESEIKNAYQEYLKTQLPTPAPASEEYNEDALRFLMSNLPPAKGQSLDAVYGGEVDPKTGRGLLSAKQWAKENPYQYKQIESGFQTNEPKRDLTSVKELAIKNLDRAISNGQLRNYGLKTIIDEMVKLGDGAITLQEAKEFIEGGKIKQPDASKRLRELSSLKKGMGL